MNAIKSLLEEVRRNSDIFKGLGKSTGRVQALGNVTDFINDKLDSQGISGEYNEGYRMACRDITAKILELLKAER